MSRINLIFVLLLFVASATVGVPASAAAAQPPGAVKLSGKKVQRVGNVTCGKVGGRWLPGARLKKGFFLTHARRSKNLAKQAARASGRQRARLKRRSASFRRKAATQRRKCAKAGGAPTPAAVVPPAAPAAPAGPAAPAPPVGDAPRTPLRFNLTGAVGLALRDPSTTRALRNDRTAAGSNLAVVTNSGGTRDAVSSGSVAISKFLIAPSDKIFVLFRSPVDLANTSTYTGSGCLLAEIQRATGAPTCIDDELSWISWDEQGSKNPPIQFDQTGAIYYSGTTATGKAVLRRYLNGATTDLITDNVWISDFLVRPDGSVFLTGQTTSTNAAWVRRITPAGGLQNLRATQSQFLRAFPDGNVYMGLWGTGNFGVRRFLTASGAVESKFWISSDINAETPERYFDAADYCGDDVRAEREGFCGMYGSAITASFRTTDGKLYVLAGHGAESVLMQYFPTVDVPATAVRKVSAAQGVITNLVLAGLNDADQNVMTLFNTSTETETQLIGPDNEIEIYHLNYVANGNKVMFDGLRFADNKYVLGQVELDTGELTVSATSTGKLADFQTFG